MSETVTPTAASPESAPIAEASAMRRAAMARAHSSSIRRSGVYRAKFIQYCLILSLGTVAFVITAVLGFNNDYVIYPAIGVFALYFLVVTALFARSIFKYMSQYADRMVSKVK
jgi:hypothetical protein